MERELSCAVCMDLYNDPVLLPCAHSFCRNCLKDSKLDENQNRSQGKDSEERLVAPIAKPRKEKNLYCPTCRSEVQLDYRRLRGLQKNFLLENIVERYKESRSSTGDIEKTVPCQGCDGEPKQAAKSCIECRVSYCDECLLMCHPLRGVLAKHRLVEAKFNPQQQPLICPDHEDEKIKIYCENCRVPICFLCDRIGAHKGHQVAELKTTFGREKDILSEEVDGLMKKNEEIRLFISALKRKCSNVEIANECAQLEALILERHHAMVEHVTSSMTSKLDVLNHQIRTCQDKLESSTGLAEYVTEALKEEEPASFLLTAKYMQNRVKCCREAWPTMQAGVTDHFSNLEINLQHQKKVISSMTIRELKVPQTPEFDSLRCVTSTDKVVLRFKSSEDFIDGFDIWYRPANDGQSWEHGYVEGKVDVEFTKLVPSTVYQFVGAARNKAGQSTKTAIFSLQTKSEALKFNIDVNLLPNVMRISPDGKFLSTVERISPSTQGTSYAVGNVSLMNGVQYWEASLHRLRQSSNDKSNERLTSNAPAIVASVGVVASSSNRSSALGMDNSSWALEATDDGHFRWFVTRAAHTQLSHASSHVGIMVNYSKGCLMFFDQKTKSPLMKTPLNQNVHLIPGFAVYSPLWQMKIITGLQLPESTLSNIKI
ncbi:E3 ubiquitin-protein ligase Midline-1-like isoform X2 [Anneissia japonica]|uniref:E3 ubiquitin-protein ligase Midline-1-like isoform X2 n=1 Tax=Anneissia japonica TaxID=1529436 RepID=UPI0014254BD1|nr:E3 ubiquitin-protein ligase Midline-1-like isoform X2 [Anneissia japonica]